MWISPKKVVVASCLVLSGVLAMTPAYARTYKIAHAFAATHPFTAGLERFAKNIDTASNGRIKFDVVHGGVLGGEVEMIPQIMSGSLDSAVFGGISVFQSFSSKAAITELPFLFPDAKTAFAAFDGKLGDLVAQQIINPLGIEVLGYMENGFRHFTNNKRPIIKPEDMKGIKFRSAASPLRLKMFEALGTTAVPIALPELFTALQQGTVDGQENPLVTIESSKFYEVQKYLSLSGHIFDVAPIVISQDVWKSFSAEDKALIQAAMNDAKIFQRELCANANEKILEKLKASGMQINAIDKELFVKAVQPVWDGFIKEHGRELIDAAISADKK